MSELPTTVNAIADALEARQITALEVVESSLAAAGDPARQGPVSFIEVFADEARAQARAIDAARARGAAVPRYAGVPVGIKALFDVRGHRTTSGAIIPEPIAAKDADAVAVLRHAAFVPIGHNNMTEFAYSGLGMNPHFGNPLSPWRKTEGRVAGGSTSGGAAAVAEGTVPLALGSDTGGSCRIPAAFCNLTGFKPTQSRISRAGMIPLSTTLDTVGWIARTVDCCIAANAILSGDSAPIGAANIRSLRIAVPMEVALADLAPEVERSFTNVVERLRAEGNVASRISIPALNDIAVMNRLGGFSAYESYAWHRSRLAAYRDRYDPRVRTRIERGREQTPADYAELQASRAALVNRFQRAAESFDVLLFPTVPILPPRLSDLATDEEYFRFNSLALRSPALVNMVDGCAISIPVDPAGPPIGVTIAGPAGRDRVVLAAARALETFFGRHD
jgi:aspartyl-tRNA(Asn)/glutamyl-tRNA(Gln) amidotransferase subunit A